MEHSRRQRSHFRPAAFASQGVALLLAFVLATHIFWCALAAPLCESESFGNAPMASVQAATHVHFDADVCAGIDEAKSRVGAIVSPLVAPVWIWIALVFLAVAQSLPLLAQRAAVFGRDGPVRIPPLHSRLLRASLPHRAPPVSLI